MKKREKKENSTADAYKKVVEARKELSKLKLDNFQRKLKNTSLLRVKRKEIARLLTSIAQKELQHG